MTEGARTIRVAVVVSLLGQGSRPGGAAQLCTGAAVPRRGGCSAPHSTTFEMDLRRKERGTGGGLRSKTLAAVRASVHGSIAAVIYVANLGQSKSVPHGVRAVGDNAVVLGELRSWRTRHDQGTV